MRFSTGLGDGLPPLLSRWSVPAVHEALDPRVERRYATIDNIRDDTLVISQQMPTAYGRRPCTWAVTRPGSLDLVVSEPRACFEQILRKLGFRHMEVGHNTGVLLSGGDYYDRPVLYAVR
jgi:hypothetical protein